MREYAKIRPSFWTGDTGRYLRRQGPEVLAVALYLLTCPSSSAIGLYYLPLVTLAHEVGLTVEGAREALRRASEGGFAHYDEGSEVVWIPEMACHQIGAALKPRDNCIAWITKEAEQYRKCPFFKDFLHRYRGPFHLPLEGPSKDLPSPSEGGLSMETETETETEQPPRPFEGGGVAAAEIIAAGSGARKIAKPDPGQYTGQGQAQGQYTGQGQEPETRDVPEIALRKALELLQELGGGRFAISHKTRPRERRNAAQEQATLGLPGAIWTQLKTLLAELQPTEQEIRRMGEWIAGGGWAHLPTVTPDYLIKHWHDGLTQAAAWDGRTRTKDRAHDEQERADRLHQHSLVQGQEAIERTRRMREEHAARLARGEYDKPPT